jgi:hypothetical protein
LRDAADASVEIPVALARERVDTPTGEYLVRLGKP